MSETQEQQAQELERFANRANCRPEYGGVPHYCPNCDSSIEFPVEALKDGAAALRALGGEMWRPITNPDRGLFLVTNNIDARNAHGYMSHVWIVNSIHAGQASTGGKFWCIDPWDQRVVGLTHYQPITPPEVRQFPEARA